MDRRNSRWSERCYECRAKLGPGPWTTRPIPRLGGADKDVCFACADRIDAQPTLDLELAVRRVAEVDRAVAHAHHAASNPTVFEAPVDVADLAAAEGHPLAQRVEDFA